MRLPLALGLALLAGCAGRTVEARRGPHGNLHAELSQAPRMQLPVTRRPPPTIVTLERDGVRAIDPIAGRQMWRYPRQATGHPVASDRAVYVPLRGNRLAALDRLDGTLLWMAQLPGEALTGLAVDEPFVAAVVVGDDAKARSRIVALSTEDGSLAWERRSTTPLGDPVAQGRVFVVPQAGSVVALRASSGRESARVALADGGGLPRVVVTGDGTLIAGRGNRFVNLRSASHGHAPAPQSIDTAHGVLFPDVDVLDEGQGDGERLTLALAFPESGEAPRQGVLLSRRVVVSARLDPHGRPLRARWVYHDRYDRREFVAVQVGEHRVTLIREDGAIIELDADSGALVHKYDGLAPADGALLLDLPDRPADRTPDGRTQDTVPPPSERKVVRSLMRLIGEEDARLLPAQMLAVELLWRSEQVRSRRLVHAVASEVLGPWHTEAGQRLARHADVVRKGAWGPADPAELARRADRLSQRPSFLAERSVSVAELAREAIGSGTPDMVGHLAEHLLHPATPIDALPELVETLGTLGGREARDGLLKFVRAYHADPAFVAETPAVFTAVEQLGHLVAEAGAGSALSTRAVSKVRAALRDAAEDPFTDPALRVHIEATLASLPEPFVEGEPVVAVTKAGSEVEPEAVPEPR